MMPEEGGGGQKNHRAVDSPPHNHGEKCVEKLVAQGLFHRRLALFIDFAALDNLRMQKQIVRHHHGSQHAHDDKHAAMGHRRHHPRLRSLEPIDVDKEQFVDKRQPDDTHKTYDCALHAPVGIREKQQRDGHHSDKRAPHKGYTEEHLQRNGRAQYLCKRRGYAGQHGTSDNGTAHPCGCIFHGGLAQAQSRHNAEVGHVVLKGNEHDG